MPSRNPYKLFYVVLCFLLLQGCAALQEVFQESSIDQSLLDSDIAMTRAIEVATSLRQKGNIPDSDWPRVKENLQHASVGINRAWAAYDQLGATHGSGEVTFEMRDKARAERKAAETLMAATP